LVSDLIRVPIALAIYPLFLFIPGYVLGWFTNAFGFQRHRLAMRMSISIALSISVCPIVTYLVGRLFSFLAVWFVYVLTWWLFLAVFVLAVRQRGIRSLLTDSGGNIPAVGMILAVAAWVVLGTLALIDVKIGRGLYVSWVYGDYAKHIAVTNAITQTGIPPANPFFHPGERIGLFFYYFWWLMCSLVNTSRPLMIEPRHAVFAGTIWAGIALVATVALFLRLFLSGHRIRHEMGVFVGLALLVVSGFDLVPIVGELVAYAVIAPGKVENNAFLFLGTTGWNHNALVESWLNATLWVPHHVTGFIACLTGFLLFRDLRRAARLREQVILTALSGFAFASAIGLSVWVTFVFAIFLASLALLCTIRKSYADARYLVVVGAVAGLLSAPYLIDLQNANQLNGAPVSFAIRTFGPVDRMAAAFGWNDSWRWLIDLLVLPANYLIEFGFVGIAAVLYWTERLKSDARLVRDDVFLIGMFSTSLLVCTFLRSSVKNNDLGWRGMMVAQFVLLVWSATFIVDRLGGCSLRSTESIFSSLIVPSLGTPVSANKGSLPGRSKIRAFYPTLSLLVLIGVLATAYDLASTRLYAPLKSAYGDAAFTDRFYAMRQAYRWLNSNVPDTAIVQHNPDVDKDFYHELYSRHSVIVSDRILGTLLGVSEERFNPVASQVAAAFSNPDQDEVVRAKEMCQEFPINVIMVKDTDPVWNNSQSWVWRLEPIFSNGFARVFACEQLTR
jgi:hypothetical protein